MALFPLSSCSAAFLVVVLTLFSASIIPSTARRHHPLISPPKKFALHGLQQRNQGAVGEMSLSTTTLPLNQADDYKMSRTISAHVTSKALLAGEEGDAAGVIIRSSPAHPMPTYKQTAAPTPLPEFPTLGPPIVWSFPATPLPALEAPPPQDIPALPKTGSKHGGHVPPCEGPAEHYRRRHHLKLPPSVPLVAAEPATSPGPLQAPESAPAPTAGGPLSPPYY